jgi:hypothetical protein
MYIELAVETPVNLTARQKELLREFDKLGEDNNPESKNFFSKVKSFWDGMKRLTRDAGGTAPLGQAGFAVAAPSATRGPEARHRGFTAPGLTGLGCSTAALSAKTRFMTWNTAVLSTMDAVPAIGLAPEPLPRRGRSGELREQLAARAERPERHELVGVVARGPLMPGDGAGAAILHREELVEHILGRVEVRRHDRVLGPIGRHRAAGAVGPGALAPDAAGLVVGGDDQQRLVPARVGLDPVDHRATAMSKSICSSMKRGMSLAWPIQSTAPPSDIRKKPLGFWLSTFSAPRSSWRDPAPWMKAMPDGVSPSGRSLAAGLQRVARPGDADHPLGQLFAPAASASKAALSSMKVKPFSPSLPVSASHRLAAAEEAEGPASSAAGSPGCRCRRRTDGPRP